MYCPESHIKVVILESLDIKVLCDESAAISKSKGFSGQSFPEFIALVHSECSEALEEFRGNKGITEIWYSELVEHDGISYRRPCTADTPGAKPEGIPSELADVLIRIFHYCGENNIDLGSAVLDKLAYNRTRAHKHGNKRI